MVTSGRPDPVVVATTTMGVGCDGGSDDDGGRIRLRGHDVGEPHVDQQKRGRRRRSNLATSLSRRVDLVKVVKMLITAWMVTFS
uniref:Uncharacterized protein n=1 Tax=Oryza brachyantha TaxID=4533 RepID=J3MET2_ORYBR